MPNATVSLATTPAPASEDGPSKKTKPFHLWWLRATEFFQGFSLLLMGFALMLTSLGLESLHQHETTVVPIFAGKGLVLAMVGRLLSFAWSAMPYLLEHLGVVLIVAAIVRELIEKAREKEFNDKLAKTLDETAREAFVPIQERISKLQADLGITIQKDDVLDKQSIGELTEKVLSPTFIRPSYMLDLTLEPYPASPPSPEISKAYILIKCKTSYTVMNLTDKDAPFTVVGWMDVMQDAWLPPEIEKTKFTRLAFGPTENEAEDTRREYPIKDIQTLTEEALRLEYKLRELVPPKKQFFVELEGLQTMRSQDIFIWNMSRLTKELIVKVTLAGGLTQENFHVSARELHHHPGMETFTTPNSYTWKIANTLLPHQGIQIWWSRKTD